MLRGIDNGTTWHVAGAMTCGFITFYSLPDGVPFLVRLTMTVTMRLVLGTAFRRNGPRRLIHFPKHAVLVSLILPFANAFAEYRLVEILVGI